MHALGTIFVPGKEPISEIPKDRGRNSDKFNKFASIKMKHLGEGVPQQQAAAPPHPSTFAPSLPLSSISITGSNFQQRNDYCGKEHVEMWTHNC